MVQGVPVAIGGTSYRPPIPYEPDVRDDVEKLLLQNKRDVEIAIDLCLYVMKTQIFNDGNKRAAVLFASQFLITRGSGLLVVPENKVSEFKELLVRYYEGTNEKLFELLCVRIVGEEWMHKNGGFPKESSINV